MARRLPAGLLVLALLSAAAAPATIELEEVASSLSRPLGLVSAKDGSERLFIVEQGGRIKILDAGRVLGEPFLDLSAAVSCCDERGLLGLAFHPDYEDNGFFFVNYTDLAGDTVVSRFSVSSADPDRADAGTEIEILSFDQPFTNHNGGHLAFGPDGYLYIASGDGGSAGDPQNNAQSLDSPLGKLLRVDIDATPVAIPPDNPFVNAPNAMPEIWAYGLRNPWRFSFDRVTGDLFVGDVGQRRIEEIDFQPAASSGGENYGWRQMEGTSCFEPSSGCGSEGLVPPILEYSHGLGCSVTGGFRYRGSMAPSLEGVYLFGDFCSGRIWGATENGAGEWSAEELLDSDLSIASFGEDENGELFVVDLGGRIYRIGSTVIFEGDFETGDFSGWNKRRGKPRLVSPGLDGSGFAFAARAEGGSSVRSKAPNRETELRVDFSIHPSGIEQLNLDETILVLSDAAGRHVELTLRQLAKRFRVSLYVQDATGLRRVARTRISANGTTRLGVIWRAASGEGVRDGRASLLKNGRERGGKSNLETAGRRVKSLEAGFPLGTKAGFGVLLLDEFVVSR